MKSKRARPRHTFVFRVPTNDGEERKIKAKAKVLEPRRAASLTLTADDVRQSMKLHGVGNTQTCSMAVCAKRHAHVFAHPVEGYIDWLYTRAFVVSRCSRRSGLPTHCYEYAHGDTIARLNDTKGGQQQLLAELERDGPRTIRLYPVRPKDHGIAGYTKPRGEVDGSRTSKGARLRYAMAQLGGVA